MSQKGILVARLKNSLHQFKYQIVILNRKQGGSQIWSCFPRSFDVSAVYLK